MLQPKKPVKVVEKKTTVTTKPKKSKSASERIGDLTLRDVKDAGETALNLSTLGGYGVAKKKIKELTGMKSGGTMKKAKSGAKFDLNKDGKTTFKDVLIGRGVLPKTAKSGGKMKKAQDGNNVVPRNLNKRQYERVTRINETSRERANKVANRISNRRNARGAENPRMNGDVQFNMKSGGTMKAQTGEKLIKSKKEQLKKRIDKLAPKKQTMKSGGSMKKCKYGCK
jgi:hypothetical protein